MPPSSSRALVFRAALGAALILLSPLSPAQRLFAQADTSRVLVSGVVVDPLRNPIEGAEVRLVGSPTSVTTSASGQFRLFVPAQREILIQVRRPGFSAQLLRFTGEWRGQILLEPGAFQLPEVEVTSRYAKPAKYAGTSKYDDYFRRRRQGFGQFIDAEEIQSGYRRTVTDVLRGRAGIRVTGGVPGMGDFVSFVRCHEDPPRINVYVDGRKLVSRNSGSRHKLVSLRAPAGCGAQIARCWRGSHPQS